MWWWNLINGDGWNRVEDTVLLTKHKILSHGTGTASSVVPV